MTKRGIFPKHLLSDRLLEFSEWKLDCGLWRTDMRAGSGWNKIQDPLAMEEINYLCRAHHQLMWTEVSRELIRQHGSGCVWAVFEGELISTAYLEYVRLLHSCACDWVLFDYEARRERGVCYMPPPVSFAVECSERELDFFSAGLYGAFDAAVLTVWESSGSSKEDLFAAAHCDWDEDPAPPFPDGLLGTFEVESILKPLNGTSRDDSLFAWLRKLAKAPRGT